MGGVTPEGKRRGREVNCARVVSKAYGIRIKFAHITEKQNHCTPTWAIPKSPATHSKVLTTLQHATSAREAGSTSMFAKAHVPEVVPSSMKYGDIPSDVPRAMIL